MLPLAGCDGWETVDKRDSSLDTTSARGEGMARICIVGGSGYVGLGYAAALADLGNDVIGLDVAEDRVAALNRGEPLIFEPGP